MVAEGKSKVHIHVNSKAEFRGLLQRLIVKIGENKGWEVVLENIPYVKIPNIDNLVNQSQNGVVMYSDIALDTSLKTQSGDIGSNMNVAHGAMDIDCVTSSSGEQQPKFNSPDLNVDRKIVSDGKEITIEGDSSGTEDSSSDSTSSGSSGSSSGSSSSSSESSESDEKPKSLAADVENLKGGQRNGKEHPKQNVHNSVDKSNPETACPPEPDNNDQRLPAPLTREQQRHT